ncbi:hypothetical protein [Terricaulis sp.]|uniref:hypothetical protein n=1 Tax=Terricaulis sp. TaxID=2768686 RepID=UPI003783DE61
MPALAEESVASRFFFKACVLHLAADRADAGWIFKGLDNFFVDKASIDSGYPQVYAEAEPLGWIASLCLVPGEAPDLSVDEQHILDSSEVLVVVCSHKTMASAKADRALRYFKSKGQARKVLAAISAEAAAMTGAALPPLPPALRYEVDDDGALSERPQEVLAVHLRGEPRARALARIASGVMDVPFDAIWDRGAKTEIGRLWWALPLALSGVLLVGVAAMVMARPVVRDYVAELTPALLNASAEALADGDTQKSARLALVSIYAARFPFYEQDADASESRLRAALAADLENRAQAESVRRAPPIATLGGKELVKRACATTLADGRGRMSDEEVEMLRYDPAGPYRDLCRYPLWLVSDRAS